jgi:hypothetical protein
MSFCLLLQEGTNHLNDGNQWTQFWLDATKTGVTVEEKSYGKLKSVAEWTWNEANIPRHL